MKKLSLDNTASPYKALRLKYEKTRDRCDPKVDLCCLCHYHESVITDKATMESIELDRLALQIEHLLQAVSDLRAENQCLRNQLVRHAREKSLWHQSNRQTAGKIKKIISHLQEALG